jgi:hypothetical protein
MRTPLLHIARLEAELADRCLALAHSRQRVAQLEEAIEFHMDSLDAECDADRKLWSELEPPVKH